jgi:transcriptional regulator with XRE-family HTH domain
MVAMDTDDAVRQVFGMALRQLRTEAGLSLRALGQAAHYDFSRVERGEHLIHARYVAALDKALGTGGLLGPLRSLAPDDAGPSASTAALPAGLTTLPTGRLLADDGDSVTLQLPTPDGGTLPATVELHEALTTA